MNKILFKGALTGAALLSIFAISSCDSKQKLSEDLSGIWTGQEEQLTNTGAARASMVRMLQFTPTGTKGEGDFTMTAYITVDNTMPSNDEVVTPLTITASGVATITGVYQVKDGDELILNLDASSLSINVDPDAVELKYNVLTEQSGSEVETLKPAAAVLVNQQIEQAARSAFSNITEIDDIHIASTVMKCEIGHSDLTFRRQSQSNS